MHLRKAGCTEAKPRGQEIPRANHEFTDPAFTILDSYDDRESDDLQFATGLIPQECNATVIRRPRFRSREIVDDDDLTFQQICRSKMWSLARFRVATVPVAVFVRMRRRGPCQSTSTVADRRSGHARYTPGGFPDRAKNAEGRLSPSTIADGKPRSII